jgi:hypothetical protein
MNAFYEWSLKRYLKHGLEIQDEDENEIIWRADQFRNLGYVMCERICHRIQEASIVVVDVSLDNPNVFYELGLAIGLNKKILVICDKDKKQNERDDEKNTFWKSIGMDWEKITDDNLSRVIEYPNVGFLDHEKFPIFENIVDVPLEVREPGVNIRALLVNENSPRNDYRINNNLDDAEDTVNRQVQHAPKDDIPVSFKEAVKAAVGVAFSNIDMLEKTTFGLTEAVEILRRTPYDVKEKPTIRNDMERLKYPDDEHYIYLTDDEGIPKEFEAIAKEIDSSFACIIDLANENPLSYFWLGYCHAREVNAIPIYRDPTNNENGLKDKKSGRPLAFDIRALWYINYRNTAVMQLTERLQGVFEELIIRDIPKVQRNIFWERLTRRQKIHIFTGALHYKNINREVVGDWDLRTVSELVRFLSSGNEAVVPELERPIYGINYIKSKLAFGGKWDERKSKKDYIALMENELKDRNCLVIASADVNPLTELVLAKLYACEDVCFSRDPENDGFNEETAVVALKKLDKKNDSWKKSFKNTKEGGKQESEEIDQIPSVFSQNRETLPENHRGFLVDGKEVLEVYKAQDDEDFDEFNLLAHLVIAKNPFSDKRTDTMIVLLNGVSGPGTFGLAEILTGSSDLKKATVSERLLADINKLWNKVEGEGKQGVEAIFRITISSEGKNVAKLQEYGDISEDLRRKYFDRRLVAKWDYWKDESKKIAIENPRILG